MVGREPRNKRQDEVPPQAENVCRPQEAENTNTGVLLEVLLPASQCDSQCVQL